jgi:magnesium transporter
VVIVDCAVYRDGHREGATLGLDDAFEAAARPGAFVWIGLHEPSSEEFAAVAEEFELHPLLVADAIKAHQRPKVEVWDQSVLVVVKTAQFDPEAERIAFAELLMIVGASFIVTVRHGVASALSEVRHALEADPDQLRCGPYAVLHAVCDRVVDDYDPVADGLDAAVVDIESEVFSDERVNPAERIYALKREVLHLLRAAVPLIEALEPMVHGRLPHSEAQLDDYFRDVEDHVARTVSRINTIRELLTDVLDANLAQISVRQNDDMRTISAWAAVLLVPTLLAGIWGMNFNHMPELDWAFGYPVALGTIAVAAFSVYRYFKRAGWL